MPRPAAFFFLHGRSPRPSGATAILPAKPTIWQTMAPAEGEKSFRRFKTAAGRLKKIAKS